MSLSSSTPPSITQHGLGLVELLIALTILAMVMTSFSQSASWAHQALRHSARVSQAVAIGEALTEHLLMLNVSDDALTEGAHQVTLNPDGTVSTSQQGSGYVASWIVTPHESVTGVRQLTIRVTWQERGRPQEVTWFTFRN